MTNLQSMAARIGKCRTLEQIKACDKSLDRLFTAGIFCASQLAVLDSMLMDALAQISDQRQ